jgi:hypothetical protein
MKLEPFAIDPDKGEEDPLIYDWSVKEHVFIYVHEGNLEYAYVIGGDNDKKLGIASYAECEGSCLDYMVDTDLGTPDKDGYYVYENVTGHYYTGDGWTTDDDMTLIQGSEFRAATEQEIKDYADE